VFKPVAQDVQTVNDVYIKMEVTSVYGKLAGNPADPLLLGLHGWSQRNGWHTWEPLMEPLAAAGFCVVSVDMPGWGSSPALDAVPLVGSRAVTVVLDILDGLQKEKAVLMGKSWGGGVAIKTALAQPKRISGLILTAPALQNFAQLHELQQPVLMTWAADDPVIPIANVERYQAALPGMQLVTYDTGGHSAAQKNAVDFAPKAIQFLRELQPQF
jgi:pimeloyl-ACP methyl ester carboxylesterase